HRKSISHGLPHNDHVRHQIMAVEAPHLFTDTPEARLHLVGDIDTAGLADDSDRLRKKARFSRKNAIARKNAVRNEAGETDIPLLHAGDRGANVIAKALPGIPRR